MMRSASRIRTRGRKPDGLVMYQQLRGQEIATRQLPLIRRTNAELAYIIEVQAPMKSSLKSLAESSN